MKNQKPSFEMTNEMIGQVMEIAERVGKLTVLDHLAGNSVLHRKNRICMIHGSLALDQNPLTLEQAAAVINGRRIIASLKDVTELQNAWEAYENLSDLDPFSIDALLDVHRTIMYHLEGDGGVFRPKKVNVVDESGQILHVGTLSDYYSKLVMELLDWMRESDMPVLVKSCAFRYEFERMHPFANGNGRLGRLWHTLFLTKWNALFSWLPVDAVIQEHQAEYYKAINTANDTGKAEVYLQFLLTSINTSLERMIDVLEGCLSDESDMEIDARGVSDDGLSDEENCLEIPEERTLPRWEKVRQFLSTHELVRNADIRMLFSVSSATANRILARLAAEGKLMKCHEGGHWAYRLRKE